MKHIKTTIILLVAAAVFFVGWRFLIAAEIVEPQIYSINLSSKPLKGEPITLIAVGDIMLSRTVEQKMLKYNDWLYPFRETYQITTTGDIVFGNLESPIIEGPIVHTGEMMFRTDPQSIAGLQFGGFNMLSLANNHMKNQGTEGIQKTIEYLDQADIEYTGAGLDSQEAKKPAFIKINNTSFGFLAYVDSSFTPASYEATDNRAGSPFLDEQTLIEDIAELKEKVDIIVISMHAGTEYSQEPNQKQIDFAQTVIDNGARLVIGHHPHVVQPIEKYKNGYILYSLGNFVFDQMWSEPTRESAIAVITFNKTSIDNIELIPIKIFDYCQPRILSNSDGQFIIERMKKFTF